MAIIALALGVGASTIVFSVVYNVFFHSLPYKNFDRSVVAVLHDLTDGNNSKDRRYFNAEEVRAFREQNDVFEDVIGYARMRPTYDDGKSVRYFSFGAVVTANTFDYLGVPALLGRMISEEDGRPEAAPVFVMNYRLWQREFGGDPRIVGTVFVLNGRPTTLIGIMPSRFNAFDANFWLPATREYDRLQMAGRLKRGVSLTTAGANLNSIAHRLHKPNPNGIFPEEKFAIVPQTMLDSLIGDFRKTLYALLVAVFLLLMIACSNVSNLLLARATTRERELAIRAALGATRGRIVRQLLVESFVLALAAAGAGCALAYFGLKLVVALIPAGALPDETVIGMNGPVLLAALGVTILTAIFCGLAPALHVVRGDLQPHFSGSGKGATLGLRQGILRGGLAIGEIALSIVLLVGAGLLMRSFLTLTHVDLGFDPKNVLYFELNLPPTYNTDVAGSLQKKNALTRRILDRLRGLPGVTSAAELSLPPPLKYESSDTIIPGMPHTERWETRFEMCSEGYFRTLGLPLVRGRFFSENDVEAARNVAVINEAFARQYFAGEDPLGHRFKLQYLDSAFLDAPHDTYFEIIGIVRDYKTRGYDDPSWQAFPQAFIPYSVAGFSWRTFMARTTVDPSSLLRNMGQEVRELDPGVQISASGTLETSLQDFYRGPQFQLVTLASFAAIGLVLVVIGIFSVMAYSVSLQTREIGIRMALGSTRTQVTKLVLGKVVLLLVSGLSIGWMLTLALKKVLSTVVEIHAGHDLPLLAGITATLAFVGIL
ncbi:MAG TPA: ABC transporter permease, partial [Verrucomicrobiae bacterium]|nr:ABC transporter permease [Verrucomicrobiae bacterium]